MPKRSGWVGALSLSAVFALTGFAPNAARAEVRELTLTGPSTHILGWPGGAQFSGMYHVLGVGIPDAPIVLEGYSSAPGGSFILTTRTDDEGRFRFSRSTLLEGRYELIARSAEQSMTEGLVSNVYSLWHGMNVRRWVLRTLVSGPGFGRVVSEPYGISCPDSCGSGFLHGASMTLYGIPNPGSRFYGWVNGPCSGTADPCPITVTQDLTVSAWFEET